MWSEKTRSVSQALEQLVEDRRDVLGPHQVVDPGDPTSAIGEGTWMLSGFVIVTEWVMMENAGEVNAPGGEYVRLFSKDGMTDAHAAGLLHDALYNMD